eukprot:EC836347.1.p3 GENE.EC836347.1~~EC836347.1.p3  ORF type:complete len:53 (+),score=4.21 EC836347.1:438-596(+)
MVVLNLILLRLLLGPNLGLLPRRRRRELLHPRHTPQPTRRLHLASIVLFLTS